jgi:hypothetical protein
MDTPLHIRVRRAALTVLAPAVSAQMPATSAA